MEWVTGFPPEPAQVVHSFNNYPFFAGNHSLELSYSYITDLVLNSVPYIGVGTGLSIICLVILIIRFTCLRKKWDQAELSSAEMKPKIVLRVVTTFCILIIACAAAFGFLGTHILVESLSHDENSLDSSIHWMTGSANFFYQSFSSVGLPSKLNSSYTYYSEVKQALQNIEQEATQFKNAMNSVLITIQNTLGTVKRYSSYSFYGAYGLMGLITAISLLLVYVLHYRPLYVKIPSLVLGIFLMWFCWIILSLLLILLWGSSSACHLVYLYFKRKSLEVLPSALRDFIPVENNLPSISIKDASMLQQAVIKSFQSQVGPIMTVLNETLQIYESCKTTVQCEVANLPLATIYMHTCSSDQKYETLRGSASAVEGAYVLFLNNKYLGLLALVALGISYVDPLLGHRTRLVKPTQKESTLWEFNPIPMMIPHAVPWLDIDMTRPNVGFEGCTS
ncbi:uncharacterized protein Gasu_46070 [Galdieria sulphuraria]|uniref:Uncharacterized protein n=1 Tax=Galdieria sulphuraria TaxID=130081 RepID=M2XCV0_GALSU|nr:uncharacterized protein Gasu_46070 [Galdieria sulphuraria]EME27782.1 hypothetical protein Gasu_46070 [Galdieria sulphuraria]|eukprot:XP_005704302.1 hypothetical protein Gasu_46070 [Galdieria sulphuraria]